MATKTKVGYKLFEMNKHGRLFPLFIGSKQETPVGEWVHAEFIPTQGFAPRGGWHLGANYPDAPWLKSADGQYHSQRGKTFRRVWAEVAYNDHHDYNAYVATLPKKAIIDGVPEDGYYLFREAGKGVWIISSDIKVIRILEEKERKAILRKAGYDEDETFAPYKAAMAKRMGGR